MLLSDRPRRAYRTSLTHEVICQLRFPTILTINNNPPADFQEAIRDVFPRYAVRQEKVPPQVLGLGGPNPQVKQQPPVSNYTLLSADGLWKLNLTQNFIALSTLRYTGWEEFARQLDRPLAQFISIWGPRMGSSSAGSTISANERIPSPRKAAFSSVANLSTPSNWRGAVRTGRLTPTVTPARLRAARSPAAVPSV